MCLWLRAVFGGVENRAREEGTKGKVRSRKRKIAKIYLTYDLTCEL